MRVFVIAAVVVALIVLVGIAWLAASGPTEAEAERIAAVLRETAPAGEPAAYAHCASCHLHDGSGRPDGAIPRLNGQRRSVLQHKLYRLRAGTLRIPVMDPFARALEPAEVEEIAGYLAQLPETSSSKPHLGEEEQVAGAALYGEHCASCHGANGEGHDGLFASRLCGQYRGYLARRLEEAAAQVRGDADAVMQGVVAQVPEEALDPIVRWLAHGNGCAAP